MTDKKEQERRKKASLLGGGILATLAAREGISNELFDRAENAEVPKTRNFADFQRKLKPGDVIFHRTPAKFSRNFELPGGTKLPATYADLLMAFKGDPHYHNSVYMGSGRIGESYGASHGIIKSWLDYAKDGRDVEDFRVYRPKSGQAKALEHIENSLGRSYPSTGEKIKHGLSHLAGLESPSACPPGAKGSAACTELVTEAYPKIFKNRYASPIDMRNNEAMELVARYGRAGAQTMREKVLSRGVYPLLKNLKWGVGAWLGAYGAMSLADMLRKERDEQG